MSRTKTLCKASLSVVLDRAGPGCPAIWVGDVPGSEKLYARNIGLITGEHWTGSPNKSIEQIGKNCPKNVQKLCFQPLRTIFGHFSDNFSTFFGHFVEIPFFWAVQRFAHYNIGLISRCLLKTPKTALKYPNRHLTEGLGEPCLNNTKLLLLLLQLFLLLSLFLLLPLLLL